MNLEVQVGSPTLWTSKRTMQAWNSQRYIFGQPIPVGFAFKRPWERWTWIPVTTLCTELHLMFGQTWSNAKRATLRNSAKNSGLWSYVEPASLTPTWVHFDKRALRSACSSRWFSTS